MYIYYKTVLLYLSGDSAFEVSVPYRPSATIATREKWLQFATARKLRIRDYRVRVDLENKVIKVCGEWRNWHSCWIAQGPDPELMGYYFICEACQDSSQDQRIYNAAKNAGSLYLKAWPETSDEWIIALIRRIPRKATVARITKALWLELS